MINCNLIDKKRNVYQPNPEEEYEGPSVTVNSLEEKLLTETGGTYELSRTKLRWYHNLELVERPKKDGRLAIYPFRTFWDLLAIQTLLEYFNLSIKEIQALRKKHSHLYSIAFALQNIENEYRLRNGVPMLYDLFKKANDPTKDLKSMIGITYEDMRVLAEELEQLPRKMMLAEERIIPKIRKEFFNLVRKGVHPLHIAIEYEE
ncbi:MAG: hypothetical protein JSU77_06745 [Fidelibacterota bacterium]|nr:MAG: hypothetical protein JSU77_06745 [Candidatus Neomarinimicrobiota bacterium]